MNNEPLVPPPSSNSQPEKFSTSTGHEWNNGITRRSFLKRTGGATLATMVTWHGLVEKSFANEDAGELVTIKVTFTIPAGQSFMLPTGASTPDNHTGYEHWATKVKAPMKSNQKTTNWVVDFGNANIELINGAGVVWGPATIVFTREIVDN